MGCRSNRRVKSSSGCRSSWQPGLVSAWTDAALHEIPSGQHHGRCSTALAARDYKPTHTHDAKQLLVKMAILRQQLGAAAFSRIGNMLGRSVC